MSIYLGGSRHLPPSPIVAQVVQAIQSSGQVHVGCATGADQQVIQAARPSSLVVFAAFDHLGAGGWTGSAVQVVWQAKKAGASVQYLAGGSLSVPLRARLICRSQTALIGCSAAVFFCPGSGSLAVAAHAVQSGIPVFAFGGPGGSIPGQAGQWLQSQFCNFPCWQFQPKVQQPSLF